MRVLWLVLVSSLLWGCGGTEDQNPDASSSSSTSSSSSSSTSSSSSSSSSGQPLPGDPESGLTHYQSQCQVCHGPAGEGSNQLNSPALVGCSICDNPESLSNYIDTTMPPGAASGQCTGACADDVAAYISATFNPRPDLAACASGEPVASPAAFKRLSRVEYRDTLQDLLQLDEAPDVSAIPDDPSVHNFQTVARVQTVQAGHLNGYLNVATEQAEALLDDLERRDRVIGCDINNVTCINTFIQEFAPLAWRRPLHIEEIDRLGQHVFSYAQSTRDEFVLALQLILSSPNFIYRVEVGDSPEGLSNLYGHELASRLSFTLWGRGPSAELLAKAGRGELDSAEGLRDTAREMLNDPRARANMEQFFEQWLSTNLLQTPTETPANWYGDIFDDMQAETNRLLGEYVWGDKDFMGVFTDNRTYLTPALANYYGLPQPQSADTPITIPAGDPRANTGLLTHAANMFAKTDGDLVAIRGNWLRNTFLCKELKLPNGITDIINGKFAGYTAMEIIEARNTDTACERCHAQIDPIGVAFAPWDRSGRFDHSLNLDDFPIEPGFPDARNSGVQSVQAIAQALAQMPEVGDCLAERLFLFSRNREAAADDQCTVHGASEAFRSSGNRFDSLLLAMVDDPAFRIRLAPEPEAGEPEEPVLENLAEGRPVTTTAAQSGNPGSRLTDGDIVSSGRWSAQYFPQSATIDLGAVRQVVQTEVYPYMDRAYQYVIEVSTNGSNYTRVVDRSNNAEGGNVLSDLFAPTQARFVRLTVTGVVNFNDVWISIRELRVLGTP